MPAKCSLEGALGMVKHARFLVEQPGLREQESGDATEMTNIPSSWQQRRCFVEKENSDSHAVGCSRVMYEWFRSQGRMHVPRG